jgi:hypothetical protein
MVMAVSRQRFLFDGPGTYYIDLNQSTSLQERKMQRGMLMRHVRGGLIKDSNNESVVRINVAPATWPVKTAIKRGFKLWNKMIDQRIKEGGVGLSKGKYHDFKVFLNHHHYLTGLTNNEIPRDAGGTELTQGEWTYSRIVSEDIDWSDPALTSARNRDAEQYFLHIVGPHVDGTGTVGGTGVDPVNGEWRSVGLVRSWIDTRAEPQQNDPAFPTAALSDPLANVFDESDADDEILERLRDDNDEAPYDENSLMGIGHGTGNHADLQRVAMAATQSGAGQISALNGFSALNGLIQVHITQTTSGQVEMLLDVDMKGEKL